ncbi:hypothetical protein EVJ58_g6184 [Rhodofomes roseus]|uniref:Uncharacterized protein n=1 Tax=Rhodofomes roseus TaxID=34475 RepID=A0A4Y9Y9W5_9APHY|nr:hypothetical protein EVJ58_g6184 [Rhodofomes roseus]
MRYRAVLSLDMVRGCQTVNWRCIRAADKRRAVLLEEKALQARRKQPEYKSFLQCALCDEPWWLVHGSHSNSFLMSDHLRTKHGVQVEILYSIRNYMYTHPDGTPETPEVWLPFL